MLLFVCFVLLFGDCFSQPVTTLYDQRQTGDLNVQVHLKDVHIVALLDSELLDDYTEYDYVYDYADFTVKPIKPTTSPSSSSTASSTSGWAVEPIPEESTITVNVSQNVENSTQSSENATTAKSPIETSSQLIISTTGSALEPETSSVLQEQEGSGGDSGVKEAKGAGKRCRSGYSPDGKGRCRRIMRRRFSWIPLAMKIGARAEDKINKD